MSKACTNDAWGVTVLLVGFEDLLHTGTAYPPRPRLLPGNKIKDGARRDDSRGSQVPGARFMMFLGEFYVRGWLCGYQLQPVFETRKRNNWSFAGRLDHHAYTVEEWTAEE